MWINQSDKSQYVFHKQLILWVFCLLEHLKTMADMSLSYNRTGDPVKTN